MGTVQQLQTLASALCFCRNITSWLLLYPTRLVHIDPHHEVACLVMSIQNPSPTSWLALPCMCARQTYTMPVELHSIVTLRSAMATVCMQTVTGTVPWQPQALLHSAATAGQPLRACAYGRYAYDAKRLPAPV